MTAKLLTWPSLFAALLGSSGCSDTGPRVYTARPYDTEAGCLGEYEALGLVEAGELSARCPVVCLQSSETIYVSTVCPPFPEGAAALDATDEGCAAALVAPTCE